MPNFIQYPYTGNRWDGAAATNAGVPDKSSSGFVGFYGSNENVPDPIAACCKVGNAFYAITVGSGFYVHGTSNGMGSQVISMRYTNTDIYYQSLNSNYYYYPGGTYEPFSSIDEMYQTFIQEFVVEGYRNIRYTGNGCIVTGPNFVSQGASVTAYVTPNIGANVSASGISITHNGSPISFQYSAGIITFIAP